MPSIPPDYDQLVAARAVPTTGTRAIGLSRKERFARLPENERLALLRELPLETLKEIARDEWWWTARPEQIPPGGDWLIYLVLSGRGWGKSRAGSEWIVQRTLDYPRDSSGAPTERLVIAETIADGRNICVSGPSGILRVLDRRGIKYKYVKSPKPQIRFDNGCLIHIEGADDADVGRGHNCADVWLDEIAKWPDPRGSWIEGILPSLRVDLLGDHPRAFVTTTPKPVGLIREWATKKDGSVVVVRGSTYDNRLNLSRHTLSAFEEQYKGTLIGQQELEGVLLDAASGKVFSQAHINTARTEPCQVPKLIRIGVGVDPGATGEDDETGVVVVGQDENYDLYVLDDRTILGVGRDAALHCWRVFSQHGADRLLVEAVMGRRWVTDTFGAAYIELRDGEGLFDRHTNAPLDGVDAKASKRTRAQPVGMRCEQGRLHFVGRWPRLEEQCVEFDPDDRDSPDRLDALVIACRWLMAKEPRRATIVTPTSIAEARRTSGGHAGYSPQLGITGNGWAWNRS